MGNHLQQATINPDASFVLWVYPFIFESGGFDARIQTVESAVIKGREQNIRVWEPQRFPEDALLSFVADYLNPAETALSTAHLWKLGDAVRDHFGFRADWQLTYPKGGVEFGFGKDRKGGSAVQLALFRTGVGFLTVQASPKSDRTDDWLNFIHYFRFVRGQREAGLKARRAGFDEQTRQRTDSPYFPKTAGGIEHHPDGTGVVQDILQSLLATAGLAGESGQWWKEIFIPGQMMPFASVFAENLPETETENLRFRLRHFFHAGQLDAWNSETDHPGVMPYAKNHWFVFSMEGGGFLSANAPDTVFFRQTLPEHLQRQYFLLFLIALHQRFALMSLTEKVAANWLNTKDKSSDEQREKVFEEIHSKLLLFTARGYFTQITQNENHHRCYQKWQEIFQTARLYREISDEVREMHEYLMIRQTRRLENRISFFGVFIGIPSLIMMFLSLNINGVTVQDHGLKWWVALLLSFGVGFGLSAVLAWWLKRR